MRFTLTPIGNQASDIAAPPDIVWGGTVGDFQADDARGLASTMPLETAIIMALFTDAPADDGELRYEHAGDFRGWPGDGIDGVPLGSKLWLYRRSELTDSVAMMVKAEIERALSILVDLEVVARITVSTEVNKAQGQINALVEAYGRDGARRYANKFELLWRGR